MQDHAREVSCLGYKLWQASDKVTMHSWPGTGLSRALLGDYARLLTAFVRLLTAGKEVENRTDL